MCFILSCLMYYYFIKKNVYDALAKKYIMFTFVFNTIRLLV